MAKEYKAFISYRHLPADSAVAEKLHKRIEHYRIPRDLRPGGESRMGRVFRDQEELPLSSSLDDSIHTALRSAEYLIVVCSSETPKSAWVREEVRYFLSTHDRDHVLAVLIDGEPDTAFPPELLHEYAADGVTVLRDIEPVAADIRAGSAQERSRLFSREIFRIYAGLLNRDFDDLYRREQRYRVRRILALAAVVTLAAALFIGMLLDRNAQIREQLRISRINESRALAGLSSAAYDAGNYRGALNYALDALPGRDPTRPYVPEAEKILSDELYLYRYGIMRYTQSIEQATPISDLCVSPDGSRLVTRDENDLVRIFDAVSGQFLWEIPFSADIRQMEILETPGAVLLRAYGLTALYSLEDGSLLWEREGTGLIAVSEDHLAGLAYTTDYDASGWYSDWELVDLRDGSCLRRIRHEGEARPSAYALSADHRYGAVLMRGAEEADILILFDFEQGTAEILPEQFLSAVTDMNYTLCFSRTDDLVLCGVVSAIAAEEQGQGSFLSCYARDADWAPRFRQPLDFLPENVHINNGYVYLNTLAFMNVSEDCIRLGWLQQLCCFDLADGRPLWTRQMPAYFMSEVFYEGGGLGLLLSNGDVTLALDSGALASDQGLYSYASDYDLYTGCAAGPRYAQSSFVLVPANNRRLAAVVRLCGNRDLEPLLSREDFPSSAEITLSPTGRMLGCFGSIADGAGLTGTLVDLAGEAEPLSFSLADLPWYRQRQDQLFLTETGLIVAEGMFIDPREGTVRGTTRSGEPVNKGEAQSCSAVDPRTGSIFTASIDQESERGLLLLLWQDGELTDTVPFPADFGSTGPYSRCVTACSAAAYVLVWAYNDHNAKEYRVYSVSDGRWYPFSDMDPALDEICAFAAEQPWLAVQRADGTLCVYDMRRGQPRLTLSNDIPAASVVKLCFAMEDRLLAVFSGSGELALYDTASGQLLSKINCEDINLRFTDSGRCRFYPVTEQGRLLVVFDASKYTEAACLVFDLDSWASQGIYSGVCAYLPDRGLVVKPYLQDIFTTPLLRLEDMMARAEALLKEGLNASYGR